MPVCGNGGMTGADPDAGIVAGMGCGTGICSMGCGMGTALGMAIVYVGAGIGGITGYAEGGGGTKLIGGGATGA